MEFPHFEVQGHQIQKAENDQTMKKSQEDQIMDEMEDENEG